MTWPRPTSVLLYSTLLVTAGLIVLAKLNGQPLLAVGAVVLLAIILLASAIIPEYLTAILFFLLAIMLDLAPLQVVLSGFASTALWLVFGGLVIGVAVARSGLGERVARTLAARSNGSYVTLIAGAVLLGYAFAFIMPAAMGRVILLVPVAIALAAHFGFKPGSNGYTGIIMGVALGQFIPAFSVLPANVPNMVLAGIAESQLDTQLLFGEYLFLHFPVLGLGKAILIIGVLTTVLPDHPKAADQVSLERRLPLTHNEKLVGIIVCLLLALWALDFVHHVSPAWIALAGAIVLLLPQLRIIDRESFAHDINVGPLLFIAGVIGIGNLIEYSGLGQQLSSIISLLPLRPMADFVNYLSISLLSTLVGISTALPGAPAVITPLTTEMAAASGLPIKTVLMLQIVGLSTFPFAYQAPSIVVGLSLAGISLRHAIKPMLWVFVLSYLALLPLNYLWWKLTGWM